MPAFGLPRSELPSCFLTTFGAPLNFTREFVKDSVHAHCLFFIR
jgi:hypothetical protein